MEPIDRLIEIDIDALGGAGAPLVVDDVIQRLAPLFDDARRTDGEAGLVLNLGWLMDPIVLWSGSTQQRLPIRSKRLAAYAALTYGELAEIIASLRAAASDHGFEKFRVGMLVLGVGEFVNEIVRKPGTGTEDTEQAALYQESGQWFERHPELFPFSSDVTLHGPGVDWRATLAVDANPYASRPAGIRAGEDFGRFFADQWASVSRVLGLDLLLMRDETTSPVHAGRMAFDASSTPATADEIDEWTTALVSVTRAIKAASPETMLVLYSSGLSPTVELRYGRLDIARVAAEGEIDAWIDQTWGGAWQDWWDAGWQGWSFQLTNLLARAALIAEGNQTRDRPCRHYPLFQLLDGWEPYDTLHDYPQKLAWSIWAFSHASVREEQRDRPLSGAYLAVANDRTGALIAEDDVAWISATMTSAATSAAGLERVLGATMVVSARADAERASITAEAVEDAAGFLVKWGYPVLASTSSQSVLLGSESSVIVAATAVRPEQDDVRRLIVGAPEDLDKAVADRIGVVVTTESAPSGYRRGISVDTQRGLKRYSWPYMGSRAVTTAHPGVEIVYDGEDGPTAVRRGVDLWWLPPHVANGADRRMTHYQVGTVDPHIAVAWRAGELAQGAGDLYLYPPERHEPLSLHAWISGGALHVLLGNVESGWIGDSRHERTATVILPAQWVSGGHELVASTTEGSNVIVRNGTFTVGVPPEGFTLVRVTGRDGARPEGDEA